MYIVCCLYEGLDRETKFVCEAESGYEAIKQFIRDGHNSQTVRRLRVRRMP